MIELAAEVGYDRVTVRGLSRLAGVSTATFYKHFQNAEECFASTYESLTRCALRRAYTAQRETEGGAEGVRAALRTLLDDVADHRKEAHLVLVEAYGVGPEMRVRMGRATAALERILVDGFPVSFDAPTRSQVARGIAAGVTRVVRTRLLSNRAHELPGHTGELADWIASFSDQGAVEIEPLHRPIADPGPHPRRNGAMARFGTLLSGSDGERGRILTAVTKLSLTGGFSKLSLAQIRAQADVSRRTFHTHFVGVDDCYLTAIEEMATSAVDHARRIAHRDRFEEMGVQQLLDALCAEAAGNQPVAHLILVETLAPGLEGLRRRDRLISSAVDHLRSGSRWCGDGDAVRIEAAVASVWRIAETEVEAGRGRELSRLTGLLAQPFSASEPSTPAAHFARA
jgi:AcrR family transcriptional regulator